MDGAMSRPSLVLVEDHQDSLDAFSIVLGEKYAVFAYTSPVEALQAIDTANPAVLVLDIGMQPLDGIQCLETIRGMPGYRNVPAVALTGFAREVDRRRFLDHGFQAVVAKPVCDLDGFMRLIDSLVISTTGVDRGPVVAESFERGPEETEADR